MFRPIPLFIGLRYSRVRRGPRFISFISLFSLVGIMLGVMALITVLSVMNGFEQELKTRILGVVPQAIVTAEAGQLTDWQPLAEQLRQTPGIAGVAPLVVTRGMLQSPKALQGVQLFGIDPVLEPGVSVVPDHMVWGSLENLQPGTFGVVLGRPLADRLGVAPGDKIRIMVSEGSVFTPFGRVPSQRRFTLVGLFEVGSTVDQSLAYVHQTDAARLLRIPGKISGLRLSSNDAFATPQLARQALDSQDAPWRVQDWREEYGALFAAVSMEKKMMGVMLVLVIAVAAFNIIASLVMVVREKRTDIAILRTQGMSTGQVMTIFLSQGMYNGMLGSLLGTGLGLLLAGNLNRVVQTIEAALGVYLLGGIPLPVLILPQQISAIATLALLLSFLATLYPAWRATRIPPVEALRYE